MEREKLKQTLAELHNELGQSVDDLDEETKGLLQQLSGDIQRLTVPETVESDPPAVEQQGMLDQLLNLTEEFEESHPKLAEAIGRVATALSRIGI